MSEYVKVVKGIHGGNKVEDVVFPLVRDYRLGKKGGFITVDGTGNPAYPQRNIRIMVDSPLHYERVGESVAEEEAAKLTGEPVVTAETDEEIMERIAERFDILKSMTEATINGDVRGMIVTGPPGVGKSYIVETTLEKASLFDKIADKRLRYDVVKGAMTALGLYAKLYEYSDAGNVLVFDDCDTVLFDDLSLNILKAALDTGKRRRIHWNADSNKLRGEGIPNSYDFKGSAIFITNVNFEHVRSKKIKDHLEALQSRCHYLDLTLDSMRDKILRIKDIAQSGELFQGYNFKEETQNEILDFMEENKNRLREMSLRMALKIGDLRKMSKDNWKRLAETTVMTRLSKQA